METSSGPTTREMDRPGPEGQWNPPSGSVEACDESWSPRSNATALAGFAITTNDDDRVRRVVVLADPTILHAVRSAITVIAELLF